MRRNWASANQLAAFALVMNIFRGSLFCSSSRSPAPVYREGTLVPSFLYSVVWSTGVSEPLLCWAGAQAPWQKLPPASSWDYTYGLWDSSAYLTHLILRVSLSSFIISRVILPLYSFYYHPVYHLLYLRTYTFAIFTNSYFSPLSIPTVLSHLPYIIYLLNTKYCTSKYTDSRLPLPQY